MSVLTHASKSYLYPQGFISAMGNLLILYIAHICHRQELSGIVHVHYRTEGRGSSVSLGVALITPHLAVSLSLGSTPLRPKFNSRTGQRPYTCEQFRQLLAVGRWFPPGTPVSSTRKLISSSSFHRLDMTLAIAEAINPNKPKPLGQHGLNKRCDPPHSSIQSWELLPG